MNIVTLIIGAYLLTGIVALVILEASTHRISHKIETATLDAQGKLAANGTPLNLKSTKLFLVFAIFLFWPAVFIGMVTKEKPKTEKVAKYNAFLDYDLTRLLTKIIRKRIKKNG